MRLRILLMLLLAMPAAAAVNKFGPWTAHRIASVPATFGTLASLDTVVASRCKDAVMISNESTTSLYVCAADETGSASNCGIICKTTCNMSTITVPAGALNVQIASSSGTISNNVYVWCGVYQ